jgi:hypothetical protein
MGMTTGNAIPGGAVLTWMNSEDTNTWSGNVGTNVGEVTCGGVTHTDVNVVVNDGEYAL